MRILAIIVTFLATALFVYLRQASADKYMVTRDQIGPPAARPCLWAAWACGLLGIVAVGAFAWLVVR